VSNHSIPDIIPWRLGWFVREAHGVVLKSSVCLAGSWCVSLVNELRSNCDLNGIGISRTVSWFYCFSRDAGQSIFPALVEITVNCNTFQVGRVQGQASVQTIHDDPHNYHLYYFQHQQVSQ